MGLFFFFFWIINFLTYSWYRMKCQNVHAGILAECIWHVVKKGMSRLQMRRGWGGGNRHQCRLSLTDSSDGDVRALVPEKSSWHKSQVCDYWVPSTHRSWFCHTVHDSQEAAEQAVFIYLLQQPAFCWNQQRKVGVKTFSKLTAESSEGCTDLLRRDFFKGNSEVVTSSVDSELQQINLSWLTRLVLQVPVPLVEAAPSR